MLEWQYFYSISFSLNIIASSSPKLAEINSKGTFEWDVKSFGSNLEFDLTYFFNDWSKFTEESIDGLGSTFTYL